MTDIIPSTLLSPWFNTGEKKSLNSMISHVNETLIVPLDSTVDGINGLLTALTAAVNPEFLAPNRVWAGPVSGIDAPPTFRSLVAADIPTTVLRTAPVLTHTGEVFANSYRNSTVSGNAVYNPIYPSINHYDVFQSVCHIASGSTIEHATAIAGYIKSDDVAPANGVALFGCSMATVNGAAVWGINTLLQDSGTRAIGALTGVYLVNELDFNVMCPNTTVLGLTVGGNSLSQPVAANGFTVNQLGTGIKWITGFLTSDGAVSDNGLALGSIAISGASVNSQKLLMGYFDSGSTRRSALMQVTGGGYLEFSGVGVDLIGLKITATDIYLDSGKGVRVGGNVVLTDRQAGWVAMTGTNDTGSTFNTETVTLINLARRVKAIQAAMTGHGQIGV